MSFSEVRAYSYGDDPRHIDWNVTARMDQPYVKVFEEEREMLVSIVLDSAPSMLFGSTEKTKNEIALEILAVLTYSALHSGDRVSLTIPLNDQILWVPPRKGKASLPVILRKAFFPESKRVSGKLTDALSLIKGRFKHHAVVIIISDFFDLPDETVVKNLSQTKELIFIRLEDPLEANLPKAGVLSLQTYDGKTLTVDTTSKEVRRAYEQRRRQWLSQFHELVQAARGDLLELRTDRKYMPALAQLFAMRKRSANALKLTA